MRLPQTLERVTQMPRQQVFQFHSCVRQHKAFGQLVPGKAKRLQPRRVQMNVLLG